LWFTPGKEVFGVLIKQIGRHGVIHPVLYNFLASHTRRKQIRWIN